LRNADPPLLWLRFENEARACPACASSRITLLDVFKIPRDARGRRLAFLTGCHDCGLLFVNPLPSAEQLQQQYAVDGEWAATRKARATRPSLNGPSRDPREVLLEALTPYVPVHDPPPHAKVLDFGCGEGKFLDRLQDAGWDTYGIEPSTSGAFLRHRRLERPPQDGTFDFAILHHVLEHVTEPLEILRQLASSLRQGGILFVGVPRLDTLPKHRDFKYCLDGRHHLLCYSHTCLRSLLARAGLAANARLAGPELDALTKGQPLRLRVVATRTKNPPPLPAMPLAPAVEALTRHARAGPGGFAAWMRSRLPMRVRGALLDRAVEKRARERKRAARERYDPVDSSR
jgi:SAM-dependent methyltransferase